MPFTYARTFTFVTSHCPLFIYTIWQSTALNACSKDVTANVNKKVLLRENARGLPPAAYPVRDLSYLGDGGGGYPILVLAGGGGYQVLVLTGVPTFTQFGQINTCRNGTFPHPSDEGSNNGSNILHCCP